MKNNCNFNSLKNDLKDKKQMVLFVGAGINYSEGKQDRRHLQGCGTIHQDGSPSGYLSF